MKHTAGILKKTPNELTPTLISLFVGNTLIGNISKSDVDTDEEAEANADRLISSWNEYDQLQAYNKLLLEALVVAKRGIEQNNVFLNEIEWKQIEEAINKTK